MSIKAHWGVWLAANLPRECTTTTDSSSARIAPYNFALGAHMQRVYIASAANAWWWWQTPTSSSLLHCAHDLMAGRNMSAICCRFFFMLKQFDVSTVVVVEVATFVFFFLLQLLLLMCMLYGGFVANNQSPCPACRKHHAHATAHPFKYLYWIAVAQRFVFVCNLKVASSSAKQTYAICEWRVQPAHTYILYTLHIERTNWMRCACVCTASEHAPNAIMAVGQSTAYRPQEHNEVEYR